jgi:NADH:ubiquinone reductase (non-electrogenic)
MGRLAVDPFMRVQVLPRKNPDGTVPDQGKPVQISPPSILTEESSTPRALEGSVCPDVFALGDVCANIETPLPALAQVCETSAGVGDGVNGSLPRIYIITS